MALNSVTLSSKPSPQALKEDIPPQLEDFHSQWLRRVGCAFTGMQGGLSCYRAWLCLRSHSSIKRVSSGKMKRRNPQLELPEAKAGTEDDTGCGCCVAWESQAGSNPCHSTSRARRSSKAANPFWRSKALASADSSTNPVNAGNQTHIARDSGWFTGDWAYYVHTKPKGTGEQLRWASLSLIHHFPSPATYLKKAISMGKVLQRALATAGNSRTIILKHLYRLYTEHKNCPWNTPVAIQKYAFCKFRGLCKDPLGNKPECACQKSTMQIFQIKETWHLKPQIACHFHSGLGFGE